ncbi:MAG TPA: hypothetical protein VL749_10215 [Patescibacteria group bacterium]|nr:hypothetical protein [Patescibacteria group bacterium]
MTGRLWRTSRDARRRLATLIVVLGVGACSGETLPSQQPTASPEVVATVAPTGTAKPTAPRRLPAPTELQGRWRTVINDADKPVLTITDFKYTIERLGIGTGAIEVDGDQIRFFGSNLCSGDGIYRWSIENGTLTLAPVGTDACTNRADAIRNRPFSRME